MRMHRLAELKRQGTYDPVWNIAPGKGPATLWGELSHHQLEEEATAEAAFDKRLQERARSLGCSLELVRYVETLEHQLNIVLYPALMFDDLEVTEPTTD